jgi:fructokinase
VLCVGEALVDLLPDRRGALEEVETFRRCVGGAPANVALGLARLRAHVGFVGLVGDDSFGRYLVSALSQEGVDATGLFRTKDAKTGLTFIALSASGERSFVSYRDPAADMLLALDHVDSSLPLFRSARVVHLGSTSLSRDPARTATWRAVELAKEHGAYLSCDPNLRLHIWNDRQAALDAARRLVTCADIVKLSDDEAELLYGTRDPAEAARRVRAEGPKVAAITMAERGAYLSAPHFEGHAPAVSVEVVDTTGAGDGFCAGLLSVLAPALRQTARIQDLSAEECRHALTRANAVGAAVVASLGATPGLPRLSEIES